MRGSEGNELCMENDRGTGPATPESPANLASEAGRPIEFPSPTRARFHYAGMTEVTRGGSPWIGCEPVDDDGPAEAEIETAFRLKLMGARRLPRHERSQARRAAREWRQLALRALREKRARERYARYALWRMQQPPPRPG